MMILYFIYTIRKSNFLNCLKQLVCLSGNIANILSWYNNTCDVGKKDFMNVYWFVFAIFFGKNKLSLNIKFQCFGTVFSLPKVEYNNRWVVNLQKCPRVYPSCTFHWHQHIKHTQKDLTYANICNLTSWNQRKITIDI